MITPCWITHLPARTICFAPRTWARREILLPVSVSMYSPLGGAFGFEDMLSEFAGSSSFYYAKSRNLHGWLN